MTTHPMMPKPPSLSRGRSDGCNKGSTTSPMIIPPPILSRAKSDCIDAYGGGVGLSGSSHHRKKKKTISRTESAPMMPPPTLSRAQSDCIDAYGGGLSGSSHHNKKKKKKNIFRTESAGSVGSVVKSKSKSLRKKLGSLSPVRTTTPGRISDQSVTSSYSNHSKRNSSGSRRSPSVDKRNSHGKKTKGLTEDVSVSLQLAIKDSPILSLEPQPHVNYYHPEDLHMGGKLIPGEFFNIFKIKHLLSSAGGDEEDLLNDDDDDDDHSFLGDDDDDDNNASSEEAINKTDDNTSSSKPTGRSSSKTDKLYVLKQMSQKHSKEKQIIQQATLRLVLEAKYLARLNHKNIVQATGLTHGEEEPLMNGCASRFFIVMERCVETLEERIDRWKREPVAPEDATTTTTSVNNDNVRGGQFDLNSPNNQLKMRYALDLVSALKYLHDRNIVVLNLRPETIGFTQDGTIQIRDLSCCREMEEFEGKGYGPLGFDCDLKVKGDGTQSEMAAAKSNFLVLEASVEGVPRPRYVAPEAILESEYTPAADTYSWAHILFEVLTLSKPYATYKLGQLLTKVCLEGSRPNLSVYNFPQPLETLLQISWRQHFSKRPTMNALVEAIPLLMQLSATVVANPQA